MRSTTMFGDCLRAPQFLKIKNVVEYQRTSQPQDHLAYALAVDHFDSKRTTMHDESSGKFGDYTQARIREHAPNRVRCAAMRYPPPKELLQFLEPFDGAIRELALATRSLVLEEMAPCAENMYDAYNAVAVGYGSSERLKDGVIHVAVYPGHVNIGFNHGDELDNKKGLLQGTGRRVRHITVKSAADLRNPAVRQYLRAAYRLSGMKQSTRDLNGVTSVVKAIYRKKRRPPSRPA